MAIVSLAIGIGASTAAFSVFNAVMLRPLPVSDPDRLVLLQPQRRGERFILFNPIYEEVRSRQTTLSGVFAANDTPYLKITFEGESAPAYLHASLVSGSYFAVLGLAPHMGRLLTEQDDQLPSASSDGRCAAVISYRLWVRRFGQNPAALGRMLRVNDKTCAIVGIAPPHFETHQIGFAPDVWLPLRPLTDQKLLASRGMAFFSGVMGRLAAGVEIAQAEAEVTSLYQQAQAAQPQAPANARQPQTTPADFKIHLASGAQGFDAIRRPFSAPLLIILAVVGVVLLIASVNVANLLLARGAARLPELATRAALGAGRWRLVRQLATEGLMLATLGGLLGVGLASMTVPILASQISFNYIGTDRGASGRPRARLRRRIDRDRRAGGRCLAGGSSEPDDTSGRVGVRRPHDDCVRPPVAAGTGDRAAGDVAAARQRGRPAPAHDRPPGGHRSRLHASARRHAQRPRRNSTGVLRQCGRRRAEGAAGRAIPRSRRAPQRRAGRSGCERVVARPVQHAGPVAAADRSG